MSPSFRNGIFLKSLKSYHSMKKVIIHLVVIGIVVLGCKGKSNQSAKDNKIDTSHFFQIDVIFQKDLKEIDATPYFIYKIKKIDGRKDSSAINTAILKQMAQQFFRPDISSNDLKPKYKESIFEDKTTGSITINYSTLDKELEVQTVDIIMKKDGETVKNIFIRKFFRYGTDSSAIEQLSWKPGERFQVVRSVQKKDKTETNYQTLVVWNEKIKEN